MAFTSGTATDYIDLADKFRAWITGTAGWTQLFWTPGNVTTGGMQLSLRGPGAAADKRVFINLRSQFSDSIPSYSWDIRGAVNYDASKPFGSNDGESEPVFLSLWKNTISYWFFANDRRFIIVAKINTLYMSAYCGFYLPWATPEQYPFPLFMSATDGILRAYNSTDSAHSSMVDPGGPLTSSTDFGGGKVRLQNGSWQRILNRQTGTQNDNPWLYLGGKNVGIVSPYSCRGADGTGYNYSNSWIAAQTNGTNNDPGVSNSLVPTAQGERLLLPVSIVLAQEPGRLGSLDCVYYPMGDGLTPEQTATFDSRDFIAFNNVHRVSGNDFFMVEEN